MIKDLKKIGIDHIGFVVKNRDKTIEKFNVLLGIKDFKTYIFKPNKAWSKGERIDNYELKIGMTEANAMEGCKIEIIESIINKGIHHDFVGKGMGGIHHIAYKVDNYDYWLDYFKNIGANFIFKSETEDKIIGFRRCFYAEDIELGTVYEIMEKPYFRK